MTGENGQLLAGMSLGGKKIGLKGVRIRRSAGIPKTNLDTKEKRIHGQQQQAKCNLISDGLSDMPKIYNAKVVAISLRKPQKSPASARISCMRMPR